MRRALALLLVCAVAACGAPAPVRRAVMVQPARSASPPGIDGRYRGTTRLVRSDSQFCPRSGPRTYTLERGEITLAYTAPPPRGMRPDRVSLTAVVQPDGRLQASDGVGTIDGTLRGGLLEITIASQICEHRWTMRRLP